MRERDRIDAINAFLFLVGVVTCITAIVVDSTPAAVFGSALMIVTLFKE